MKFPDHVSLSLRRYGISCAGALIFVLAQALPLHAVNPVAVVRASYDDVELVLTTYKIPYDLIEFRDLENAKVLGKYGAIFFPCGLIPRMEDKLKVESIQSRIKSVALKDDYREVDMDKVSQCLRDFVEDGGATYFSCYAFELIQKAYGPFRFHDDFPYMGMPGRIESKLKADLARFCLKMKLALYMDHPGWIALKSAGGSQVLCDGEYDTPKGKRSGPISVLMNRGAGEILYTSYHSTVFSDFRRFNIYRIAGSRLLKSVCGDAELWGQEITGRIVDALHQGEYHRMYYLGLHKGSNSIYFLSQGDRYQVDILDKDMSLIQSRELQDSSGRFDIVSPGDGFCFVRVYPSTTRRFGMYALISGHGVRIIPHQKIFIWFGSAVLAIFGLVVVKRVFFGRRFSGRFV